MGTFLPKNAVSSVKNDIFDNKNLVLDIKIFQNLFSVMIFNEFIISTNRLIRMEKFLNWKNAGTKI